MKTLAAVWTTVVAVVLRPGLWLTAGALMLRLVPDRWWRRGFVPPREYLEYRGRSVYGTPILAIPVEDLIRYLEWCKAFPGPIR